jgi:hypothetical protein
MQPTCHEPKADHGALLKTAPATLEPQQAFGTLLAIQRRDEVADGKAVLLY